MHLHINQFETFAQYFKWLLSSFLRLLVILNNLKKFR